MKKFIWMFILLFATNAVEGRIFYGENANAEARIDLVVIEKNQVYDGNLISHNIFGHGVYIDVEIFAYNVITPLTGVSIEFDFDESILNLDKVESPVFAHGFRDPKNSRIFYLGTHPPTNLPTTGYIGTARLVTRINASDREFRIALRSLVLAQSATVADTVRSNGAVITFNPGATPPPPPEPPPPTIQRKNMLVGDINGDGSVNILDFLLLTENYGRTGGDTFNPSDLVEASALQHQIITIRDTVTVSHTVLVRSGELPVPQISISPSSADHFLSYTDVKREAEIVRDIFTPLLMYPLDSDIVIEYGRDSEPLAYYKRLSNGAYHINIGLGFSLGEVAFVFAHEYGHILSNYRRKELGYNQQRWFEESIADLASLFALKRIDRRYYELYTSGDEFDRPRNFVQWYRENRSSLEQSSVLRQKNRIVVHELLDIFERHPESAWNAVRYMNRGELRNNRRLDLYLTDWWLRTPPQWQFIVAEIMNRFDIVRATKPALTEEGVAEKGLIQE